MAKRGYRACNKMANRWSGPSIAESMAADAKPRACWPRGFKAGGKTDRLGPQPQTLCPAAVCHMCHMRYVCVSVLVSPPRQAECVCALDCAYVFTSVCMHTRMHHTCTLACLHICMHFLFGHRRYLRSERHNPMLQMWPPAMMPSGSGL